MSWSARLLASKAVKRANDSVEVWIPESEEPIRTASMAEMTETHNQNAKAWQRPVEAYACDLPGCEICHPQTRDEARGRSTQQSTGNHAVCRCPTCRERHP